MLWIGHSLLTLGIKQQTTEHPDMIYRYSGTAGSWKGKKTPLKNQENSLSSSLIKSADLAKFLQWNNQPLTCLLQSAVAKVSYLPKLLIEFFQQFLRSQLLSILLSQSLSFVPPPFSPKVYTQYKMKCFTYLAQTLDQWP